MSFFCLSKHKILWTINIRGSNNTLSITKLIKYDLWNILDIKTTIKPLEYFIVN